MKKIAIIALLVVSGSLIGCPSVDVAAIDLSTRPVAATGAPVGSKVGQAESINVLHVFAQGDRGVQAAAKAGGITKIATVDVQSFGILGIFGRYTTIVTGE
ncbi:MAG: TRL-like family protein [Spirochaetales bacterium]|jgi:hypothetical protein|nr:TRL-like family protein [Spirochaetales bacterium]